MASYLVHPITRQALSSKNLTAAVVGQLLAFSAVNNVPTTAPTTVLLPASSGDAEAVLVRDSTGTASANNVTISGNGNTIDGAATLVLAADDEIAALVWDGTEWTRVEPERLFDDDTPRVPFVRATEATAAGGGAVVPGADTEVIYNDAGALAGDPDFTFDNATNVVTAVGGVGVGAAPRAAVALVNAPNNSVLAAMRNAANTADVAAVAIDGSNLLCFGATPAGGSRADGTRFDVSNGNNHDFRVAGSSFMNVAAAALTVGMPIVQNIAATATAGDVRVRNTFSLFARNAANAANLLLQRLDGSNDLWMGSDGFAANEVANAYLAALTSVKLVAAGATQLTAASGVVQSRSPIVGDPAFASPFGAHGLVTHTFAADANYVVTAAQYSLNALAFVNGAWSIPRTVTLPHPASEAVSYTKLMLPPALNMTVSTGTGATVLLTAGFWYWLLFSPAGVTQLF